MNKNITQTVKDGGMEKVTVKKKQTKKEHERERANERHNLKRGPGGFPLLYPITHRDAASLFSICFTNISPLLQIYEQ